MARERFLFFFLHEDLHHHWSWNRKVVDASKKLPGVQRTATKHVGAFMTDRNPSFEELTGRIEEREAPENSFAAFVVRGLGRTCEEVTDWSN